MQVYVALRISARAPEKKRRKGEETFLDGTKVPSIDDDPTIDLSIIVPAYNETERRTTRDVVGNT
ncbi:hypothetical protein PTSG_12271 [Salpingoeca rosetta]|uniref:Uncharacterized protein n=1 Tax=Salpingoeca rosetta (strain ATCC 50818 / BSB-021) TaxID=946362 RepID=F2UAQ8_SALR5|nr:uncharacterized protein PTSG_12271 [Salpingoeca rosetta]EGD73474.1 hypothetical protein PTSG_12271 [Salpingoeca rosetta]|eukprot:XP_004993756.1 hypothetical protein PTSG_12271 [Salpingoeca rosetta]